ncbi:MAG TPA: hypothetical protein VG435_04690 [Acidimicrobiales bacterium]|nr:hypothetical protein [Acidimicrobiales bacterium]
MTEATEAPATEEIPETERAERTEAAVAAFRRQLEGQVSVSATVVQDGLLDIWGILPEGDSRAVVERWLTETLERNLYAVTDVDSRLDTFLASQG